MSLAAPAIARSPVVADDLRCFRCGYNLRTLAANERCPECSTPIPATLDPNLLRNTDPSWTAMLAFALAPMIAGTFFDLAMYAMAAWVTTSADGALGVFLFAAASIIGRQLFWIGVLLLTASHPSISLPMRLRILRVFIRALAILAILSTLATALRFSWTEYAADLTGSALIFLYLLYIARRSGSRRLIRHTKIAFFANIVAHAIWMAGNIELPERFTQFLPAAYWLACATVLYQLLYFYFFRRMLRKSAAFARQYWHFCSPIAQANFKT